MNKQKRISLSAPQSRSSRMRNIQPTNANDNFWGTTISSLTPRNPLKFSLDELRTYIKENPNNNCYNIMETDCGNGSLLRPPYVSFENSSPFVKWDTAGGTCPSYIQQSNGNCTSGCSYLLTGICT